MAAAFAPGVKSGDFYQPGLANPKVPDVFQGPPLKVLDAGVPKMGTALLENYSLPEQDAVCCGSRTSS